MSSDEKGARVGRRVRVGVLALAGLLVIGVPSALAIHDYTDVPDSSPFHGDIAAVKRAGITAGKTCTPPGTPPTYCPTEAITREAMAAFVHRGFGRAAQSSSNEIPIDDTGVDLGSMTIQIGGVAGQTQFVKLDGAVTTYISSTTGCPCETAYVIYQDGVGAVSPVHYLDNDSVTPSGFGDDSGAATAVVATPTATTQTFRILAVRSDGNPTSTGSVTGYGALTAVTAPFGSTGTDTLGTTSASGSRASGKGLVGKLRP
jgi:hypothetical protein